MQYHRSTGSTMSYGFQKIYICYFMIFLWIIMHFQTSSRNLHKTRKRKTDLVSGTLEFSQNRSQPTGPCIHYSTESWLCKTTPDLHRIAARGPWRDLNRGGSRELPVPAGEGHVGGWGVAGEIARARAHPTVAAAWMEGLQSGSSGAGRPWRLAPLWRAESREENKGEWEEMERRVRALWCSPTHTGRSRQQQQMRWGAQLSHGGHALDTCFLWSISSSKWRAAK